MSTARPGSKLQVTRSQCTLDVNYTSTTCPATLLFIFILQSSHHDLPTGSAGTHTHAHTHPMSCAMPIMAVCLLVWYILLGNLLAPGTQLSQVTYDERTTIFNLCHLSSCSHPFSYELNYSRVPPCINSIDSHLLQFLSSYFNKAYVKVDLGLWHGKIWHVYIK